LFTGHGDMATAIEALRSGAYDYLLKPINVAELAVITDRIAEHQSLLRENRVLNTRFTDEVQAATEEARQEVSRLRQLVSHYIGIDNVGVFSETMRQIVQQAQKYHEDRLIPVLIEGETGTGKEIIARMIHFGGAAREAPFVDVNCAALTASLFESELFGYEAGAFTGGLVKGQKGKLDVAQGGTLLLDEVGEIPLELQGKLLRVMQEKEFYRVGGLKKVKTDVRIICATNANLEKCVEEGTFRKDLFYRLKVGHIVIPPPATAPPGDSAVGGDVPARVCAPERTQLLPNIGDSGRYLADLRLAGQCAGTEEHHGVGGFHVQRCRAQRQSSGHPA
jgi:two-component system, NtrC family, response regulator AtoC